MAAYVRLQHQSALVSTVFMVVGSLVLFFAPFLNGVIGGAFGGWRANSYRRAAEAALAASLISGGFFFVAFHFFELSPTYLYYGLGLGLWVALTAVGLFAGALAAAYARSPNFVSERWKGPQFVHESHHRAHEGPPVSGVATSPYDEEL